MSTATSPRSLPLVPPPAGAADPARTRAWSPSTRMGSAAEPPTDTTTPAAVTDGPAVPPPQTESNPSLLGDRRRASAGRGRPSTAGPGERGVSPGQPPTARPVRREPTGRAAHPLPLEHVEAGAL